MTKVGTCDTADIGVNEKKAHSHHQASLLMSTSTLLVDLHYLPSLEYFVTLLPYDTIRLEIHCSFQKQTYHNRCYILASQGVQRLTIPICKTGRAMPYSEVHIDYSQRWHDIHWRALCTAYGNAPYFSYFSEFFHAAFEKKPILLYEFSLSLLRQCLQLLQIEKKIELSTHYKSKSGESAEHLRDMRGKILPARRLDSNNYQPVQYAQVFGAAFNPNLSIVDLLFCKGPQAIAVLQQSMSSLSTHESKE